MTGTDLIAQRMQCDVRHQLIEWIREYHHPHIVFQGTPYALINGPDTPVTDKACMVLYAGMSLYHALYINPETLKPYAAQCYEYVNRFAHHRRVDNILYLVKEFMATLLPGIDKTKIQAIEREHKKSNHVLHTLYSGRIPCIDVVSFIKAKVGVCRHHALITAYFLQYLIQMSLLPQGAVHYHRQYLRKAEGKAIKHAWVIYEYAQKIISVDAFWGKGFANESIIDISTVDGLLALDSLCAPKAHPKNAVSCVMVSRYPHLLQSAIPPLVFSSMGTQGDTRDEKPAKVLAQKMLPANRPAA